MKLGELTRTPLPSDLPLTEEVFLGTHLLPELVSMAGRHLGGAPLVVADPDTWGAVATRLPEAVRGWPRLMLGAHPHADDETVEQVRARMAEGNHSGALAVGSGTINDVCKRGCHLLGRPYVALGTAASMNGFASGIAAIMSKGLKTTIEARPPRCIILDTEVLSEAPRRLTHAGLGDLVSKPVSDTCWWFADQLVGANYSSIPGQIVEEAVEAATASAAGLAAGRAEAHGALGKALVLSGVSMVVAGSSSPASGGEHLLSHLWDMEATHEGRETRLHGAQVGVTTCISAALYQRVLQADAPKWATIPTWAEEEARVRREHGSLAPIILPPSKGKHEKAADRLATLQRKWPEMLATLRARNLPTPAYIKGILDAAGAPSTLAALNEPRESAARILRLARDMRDRITVLDVAYDVGLLPDVAGAVLDEAGV